jgi:hypothetical protein
MLLTNVVPKKPMGSAIWHAERWQEAQQRLHASARQLTRHPMSQEQRSLAELLQRTQLEKITRVNQMLIEEARRKRARENEKKLEETAILHEAQSTTSTSQSHPAMDRLPSHVSESTLFYKDDISTTGGSRKRTREAAEMSFESTNTLSHQETQTTTSTIHSTSTCIESKNQSLLTRSITTRSMTQTSNNKESMQDTSITNTSRNTVNQTLYHTSFKPTDDPSTTLISDQSDDDLEKFVESSGSESSENEALANDLNAQTELLHMTARIPPLVGRFKLLRKLGEGKY